MDFSLFPMVYIKDMPRPACRCISSDPPRVVSSSASNARSDQRWHSGSKDIAKKPARRRQRRPTPIATLPLGPKHHSKAARTLLMAAKWGIRSVPVDELRPFGTALLQPSPLVSRMAHGQIGRPGLVGSHVRGRRRASCPGAGSASSPRSDASPTSTWRLGCRWRSKTIARSSASRSSPPPAPHRA